VSNPLSFTKELWTCGWPIDEAADRIAPRELLDQLERPYPQFDRRAAIEIPPDSGWVERIAAATAAVCTASTPIIQYFQDRAAVCKEIRENLLVRIESGQFIAIGYARPRNHGDLPVEIPIDLWEGEIDWEGSAVSGHGLEYSAVRIIPKNWLAKLPERITPLQIAPPSAILPEINRRKPGRPSSKKLIETAYEQLKKSGGIDFQESQIIVIRQIRETVKAIFPDNVDDDRGLGDEAIRKMIYKDFRREREALKIASKL